MALEAAAAVWYVAKPIETHHHLPRTKTWLKDRSFAIAQTL